MEISKMKRGCFTILVIFFALILPISGYGGIIRTSIVCNSRVEDSGKIDMEIDIVNSGNAMAYNVIATIFLADWVHQSNNLGNNPPDGKIHLNSQYVNRDLRPGRYVGVIRVNFEEQSGSSHRAYNFIEIAYRLDQGISYAPGLNLDLDSPLFNTKAFWNPRGKIRFFMKNGHQSAIKPSVSFYLPDGFTTPEPDRHYELFPGDEIKEIIPLTIDPSVRKDRTFHVVSWYEHNGLHYSQHVKGRIRVEERPVIFKGYVLFGTGVLAILFVVTYYRGRGRGRVGSKK